MAKQEIIMSMSKNSSGGHKVSLLAVVGPTASGKTALAIKIAKKYNGEIICADSRTIYRGLDIGTAKPSPEEREGIKHYGLDLVKPNQRFSVAEFQKLARAWILDIQKRGKLPVLVGGTGLYVDSVLYSYSFASVDAPRDPQNPRHLSKNAEVNKKDLPAGTVIIGLDPGKEELEKRIKDRTELMKTNRVIEEAKWLGQTYGWDSPGASGNIYQVMKLHLGGAYSLEEATSELVRLDKHLAKRQRTWFKRNKDIQWFDNSKAAEQFLDSVL